MHVEPVANWLVLQAYKTVNPLHLLVNYTTGSRGTAASASESLGTGGSVTLDIKTIYLVGQPDLDFQNSEHWTVFAVSLGHRSEETTDIVTTLLFRQGSSPWDELDLILRTAEWIRKRKPAEIITYNGEKYDISLLKNRGSISSVTYAESDVEPLFALHDSVSETGDP